MLPPPPQKKNPSIFLRIHKMGNLEYPLFWVFVAIGLVVKGESKTFWGDSEALKQLKSGIESKSMSPPGSCVSSWDFTLDPCDNLSSDRFTCGFRCDVVVAGRRRVTEVSLDSAGYSASLASISWNNLPYLQTLDLSNNLFSGPIPDSLAGLTRLTRLALSHNSFSGQIPSSIASMSTLQELYLDHNHLQGPVPAALDGLVGLKRLEIQSNKLSGRFPQLGSLKNLNFLDASDNLISGGIPAVLAPSLVQLTMRNNKLQGGIPGWLFKNVERLQVLDLTGNELSGSVPGTVFEHPCLQQLSLSQNRFSSVQTPDSRGARSELVAVDLSQNEIEGALPAFMAGMPKLSALSLEGNRLRGMIPTQYGVKAAVPANGVSQFSRLLLGGNYLLGPIPRPLLALKQDSNPRLTLADNCFYRCPRRFYFCQGRAQKSPRDCNTLNH